MLDRIARRFPRSDAGVVGAQLRRAALSSPANIAEGCGKNSRRETLRFLQIACGSAAETENHLLIAGDLNYIQPRDCEDLLGKVKSIQRMLSGLMVKLPH